MINISIIIVNYNVKEYIIPCIQSISEQSSNKLSIEIIVIDNNSKDGSVETLKNNFPNIKLIINNKNEGFTKAANLGVKYSKGKYLFILNPDTYFIDNSIGALYNLMEKNKNIALLGPRMISPFKETQQSYWRIPTLFSTILSIIHLDILNHKKNYNGEFFNKTKRVETISGGALFIKSKTFNIMGGFDQNLFWMEDIDLCQRMSSLNYEIYYHPKAKVVHYKGKSSEKNRSHTINNQLISKIKYFKKHHSKLETNIITIAILFTATTKLIILFLLSPLKISFLNKSKGYFLVIKNILFNN